MNPQTRQPAVAGKFYDFDKAGLETTLDNLFSQTRKGPEYNSVISPHAGYAYSGLTAAKAISALKPNKRFIILGPNHTGLGKEFSMMQTGSWRTPLGKVPINEELSGMLLECGLPEEDDAAHAREHSIEVQLPFLQHRFGDGISFVPITIMGFGYNAPFLKKCEELGSCIAKAIKKTNAAVIASSDFSHFISWEQAKEKDLQAIERIKDLDLPGFFRILKETRASVCGYAPIAVLMSVARKLGWKDVHTLDYTSSGDVTGDRLEVVAYAAIGMR